MINSKRIELHDTYRIGLCDGEILVNPTRREIQSSQLDLVVTATTRSMVVMLEGRADSIFMHDLCRAIKQGTKEAHGIVLELERIQKLIGKPAMENATSTVADDSKGSATALKTKTALDEYDPEEISEAVRSMSEWRLREIFQDYTHDKMSRDRAINDVRTLAVDKVWSSYPSLDPAVINESFNKLSKHIFREMLFEGDRRCDGRSFKDLRNVNCMVSGCNNQSSVKDLIDSCSCFQVDLYKPLHGSCLFQRGQTQVFCTVALDSQESAMKLDNISSIER